MDRYLIKGGKIVDPENGKAREEDLRIEGRLIVDKFTADENIKLVDASGSIVTPGLIDLHVHLREPGREDEETVETGARAAAAGGFTTICCMPNTDPAIDNVSVVEQIKDLSRKSLIDVLVIAAITKNRQGKSLTEMGALARAGAVAFSDDGSPVADAQTMRSAMEYAKTFDRPIIDHAEDPRLSAGGVMNEGYFSTILGLKGIPAAAEEIMISRDILLAKLTGAKIHIAHVSTAGSVEIIKRAKEEGIKVTCEVTPHHLALTDESLCGYNTFHLVNPPLRTNEDIDRLFIGLKEGMIDAIATDHAPHAQHEKEVEIEIAPFGMVGLETAVPVLFDAAYKHGLKIEDLIQKLTTGPASIIGLDRGTLSVGKAADVTVIDPKAKVKVDSNAFESKSRNTPFEGSELCGRVKHVFKDGRQIVTDGSVM